MSSRGWLLIGLLLGAVGGYAVARLGQGTADPEAEKYGLSGADRVGASREPSGSTPSVPATPPDRPALRGDPNPSVSPEVERQGPALEAEIERRAALVRRQHLQAAKDAEIIARQQVIAEVRRERALLEDAERGGPLELLERLNRKWVPPWETVLTPERFSRFFEPRAEGSSLPAARVDATSPPSSGDVIYFDRGVQTFDPSFLKHMDQTPTDLVFEGHGMDETLVRFPGWNALSLSGDVHGLTFRDLTLHCGNAPLDVSRKGFTLRLERCRVIGFDRGAGGSEMLLGGYGMLLATDCAFEAGWGDAPQFASLFRVHGPFMARIERTLVRGPLRIGLHGSGNAVVFSDCRFVDMEERVPSQFDPFFDTGVRFLDCDIEYLPSDAPQHRETRPLSDMNPAWGTSLAPR